jgi:hypothetical protein
VKNKREMKTFNVGLTIISILALAALIISTAIFGERGNDDAMWGYGLASIYCFLYIIQLLKPTKEK